MKDLLFYISNFEHDKKVRNAEKHLKFTNTSDKTPYWVILQIFAMVSKAWYSSFTISYKLKIYKKCYQV